MEQLKKIIKELLEAGKVNIVIGYKRGFHNIAVPAFATKVEHIEPMIFDETCIGNLAVYLHKDEVKKLGKVGMICNISTLRSIIQLTSENQLWNIEKTLILVTPKGEIKMYTALEEAEKYVQENFPEFDGEDLKKIEEINALPGDQRWDYWANDCSACIKCYACRAVCPMCYCTQCTVECNQPQWIKVSSQGIGNVEWHVMRAMHLAGRCVNCGECGRVCPVGIPVHLLTTKMNIDLNKEFGGKTGSKLSSEYAMNAFKPDDKENFIR